MPRKIHKELNAAEYMRNIFKVPVECYTSQAGEVVPKHLRKKLEPGRDASTWCLSFDTGADFRSFKIGLYRNGKLNGSPIVNTREDMLRVISMTVAISTTQNIRHENFVDQMDKVAQIALDASEDALVLTHAVDYRAVFDAPNDYINTSETPQLTVYMIWPILPLVLHKNRPFAEWITSCLWCSWRAFVTGSNYPPNANTFLQEFAPCAQVMLMYNTYNLSKAQFIKIDDCVLSERFFKRWSTENECVVCLEEQSGKTHVCTTCFHCVCAKCVKACHNHKCPVCVSGQLKMHENDIDLV